MNKQSNRDYQNLESNKAKENIYKTPHPINDDSNSDIDSHY